MKNTRLHLYLDKKIVDDFTKHIELVGYDKSKLFEKILKEFLLKNKNIESK